MDKKINDVNEMIENNRDYEHVDEEDRIKSNISPVLDPKEISLDNSRENNDECNDTETSQDISDRCHSGNIKNINSRVITEKLSLKEKEVIFMLFLFIYGNNLSEFLSVLSVCLFNSSLTSCTLTPTQYIL